MDFSGMSPELSESYPQDLVGSNRDQAGSEASPGRFPVSNFGPSAVRESVFQLIPADLMRQWKVVAFGFDKDRKTVSVACIDPADSAMFVELSRQLSGMKIELFQADPDALNRLIERISPLIPETPPTTNGSADDIEAEVDLIEAPACETPTDTVPHCPPVAECPESKTNPLPADRKSVLFITSSGKISQHLMFALTAERLTPRIVSNMDAALTEMRTPEIEVVFIEKCLQNKSELFVRKLREERPQVAVRYYATEAGLLLNNTTDDIGFELFRKNLQLLRHLTSGERNVPARHAAAVARLADAICARLDLPDHLRQVVMTAASLHNIAEESLITVDGFDRADLIGLSAGRLAAWNYPSSVVRMLRCMYLKGSPASCISSGLEQVGGSILTAADCFCHTWPDESDVFSKQWGQVEQKLQEAVGVFAGPDVLKAMIDAVRDEHTTHILRRSPFRVHVFLSRGSWPKGLQTALYEAGFTVSQSETIEECALSCRCNGTKTLVIRDSGSMEDINDVIIGLSMRGVALDQLNTILIVENGIVAGAVRLLRHGIEDIMPANCDPMAVIAKLERMQNRIEESTRQRLAVLKELGTHGSLEDMSLVDLLEVWRTNKRPVRIEVSAQSDHLTIFVDRGRIVHAECLTDTGTDAILKGMTWLRGVWSIDTVEPSELPTATVNQDIASVLLEACVRLDQASMLGKLSH